MTQIREKYGYSIHLRGMTEPDENDIEVETGIKGKELLVNDFS